MNKKYIRISKGFTKYNLYDADYDINDIIQSDPDADYYSSIYTYSEEDYNKYKSTKSVAGTTGLKTKRIVFDLDNANDIEIARQDALDLCSRLLQNGIEQDKIQIYFSGSKGFHIELNTTDEFNRQEFTNILENLAGDLQTLDRKILDEQRLFRLPLTRHQKTGLYKIPLTLNELSDLPLELIKQNANELHDEYYERLNIHNEVILPESIKKLKDIKKIKDSTQVTSLNLTFNDQLDLTNKPKWMSATRYALQEGFFKEGHRHHAFMILAATYKNNGFPKTMAYRMLKDVAERQAKRNDMEPFSKNEIWINIIESVYSEHWKGGIYSDKTDHLLIETARALNIKPEIESTNHFSINDLQNKFFNYAKTINENTLKFGIKEIDEHVFISTGMCVGLVGAPGSGKTTWAYNIMEYLSSQNQLTLFHSMDMFDASVYARLIGKKTGLSMKESLNMILNNNITTELQEAFNDVNNRFKDVIFDFRTGLTIEDIEESILRTEEATGNKLRLVVVDYLEKIRGPFTDETANSGFIASRLSDLAKKHNVCILILLQPQKIAGDPREPLETYIRIKGSGKIQQDLRVVLSTWRPGYNPRSNENDNYISLAVLKNNMGELKQFDFMWDGLKGEIKSMDKIEKGDFKQFLEQLAEEKRQQNMNKAYDPFNQ